MWIRGCVLIGHVSLYNSRNLPQTNSAFAWDHIPVFYNYFKSCKTFTWLYVKWKCTRNFWSKISNTFGSKVIWFLMGTSRLGLYWFRYRIFFKKRYGNTRIGGFLFSVRVELPFFIPYAFWWNMSFSALSLFIWLLFETSVMVL